MTAQPQSQVGLSPEEYLARERQAEIKSEYYDGEVFAMSGASRPHNLIVTNLVRDTGYRTLFDDGSKTEKTVAIAGAAL